MNKFIEYYGEHGISPVKQDISDLNIHLAKREKLYRQLGIPGIAFENKKILEVGPGSGYNSLAYILGGGICTLVEPNKTGVNEIRNLFGKYDIQSSQYKIIESPIEEADISDKYDIVIAEGFLHAVDNAGEIINLLSKYVKDGGVIVVTCMDSLSMFVEQMKRLFCHYMIKDIDDYNTQVSTCVELFFGQMQTLNGMSRSVEDWVKDDMLNPAFNNVEILTFEKAIKAFSQDFSYLGSSQRIFTDYSWYKDLAYDERADIFYQYKIKRHNFLMTGLKETIFSIEDSEYLEKRISDIRKCEREYEDTCSKDKLSMIRELLTQIRPLMSKIDDRCVSFVDDVKDMVDKMLSDAELDLSEYECFNKATGRTQLYLSMVKNKYFKI